MIFSKSRFYQAGLDQFDLQTQKKQLYRNK